MSGKTCPKCGDGVGIVVDVWDHLDPEAASKGLCGGVSFRCPVCDCNHKWFVEMNQTPLSKQLAKNAAIGLLSKFPATRADDIERARAELRFLSPAERLAVFERFCHVCGHDTDTCTCTPK